MPKTREQKGEILRTLIEKIKKSKSIFFAKYTGMNVVDSEKLRNDLRKNDSEFLVAKKTLINLALKENKIEGMDAKKLDGQVALLFGYGDEIVPVKEADKYAKEKDAKLQFLAGILEGRLINAAEVKLLANMPSRPELYAKLVGSINAPVSGFVNALAGNLKNVVYALNAIKEKKTS